MNFMYYLAVYRFGSNTESQPLTSLAIKELKAIDKEAAKHIDNTGNSIDNTRQWMTFDKSLLKLSRVFTDTRFELREECLEAEEYVIHHYLHGKTYQAEGAITYPPFDPEELE